MRARAATRGLAALSRAELARVTGGGILLPALAKARHSAPGSEVAAEEITIASEELVRII